MSTCLFCKIITKEIPAKIEFENNSFVVIHDIHPQAPTHLLLIPKKHIAKVSDAGNSDEKLMGALLLQAQETAKQNNLQDYRLVVNNGSEAGQTVFHIHLHLLGGRPMTWPPG
jgi:histidine triad (HIT) family protein